MGRTRGWHIGVAAIIVGMVLLSAAGAMFSAEFEPDFLPFIMSLVGGVAVSMAVVGFVLELPGMWSWIVHVLLVVGGGGIMMWSVETDALDHLDPSLRYYAFAVAMGAGPAIGWLAMTLLSRITGSKVMKAKPVQHPEWVHQARRATITFAAVPMSLVSLTWWIIGVVLIGGLGIAGLLILTGDTFLFAGPRLMLFLLALFFGIPAYAILILALRRRQQNYVVQFGFDRLEIHSPTQAFICRYVDIRELDWGGSGEYSRLRVVSARGQRHEIVAGLAKAPKGVGKTLPPLPRVVLTRMERDGLVKRVGRVPKPGQPQRFSRSG